MKLSIKKPGQLSSQRPPVYCKRYLPLVESSVLMLFSGGGVGKSFAAVRECIEFVDENPNKSAALWLTEDPEGETRNRYEEIVKEMRRDKEFYDQRIAFISHQPVKLTKMRDGNAILSEEFNHIRLALLEYSLIVFDPLLQFNGCDENSNTHAGVLMGALKDWVAEERKIILLLHHATWNATSNRMKPRGAGEWVNGTRGVYSVDRIMTANGKEPDHTKKRQRLFTLVKDNGLSYHFMDSTTGRAERELDVFPEFTRDADKDDRITLSIADHNDKKNSQGFVAKRMPFDMIHAHVTDGVCYSPYIFANGHRKNINNLGGSDVMCFDFDNGLSFDNCVKKFEKLQALMITTKSHRLNGNGDRFRMFVKLKTPLAIPDEDYSEFMDGLFKVIGDVDPATKDLGRFYFASPSDAFYHYTTGRELFDWTKLYSVIKQKKVKARIEKELKEKETPKHVNRDNSYTKNEPMNTIPKDTIFNVYRQGSKTFGQLRDELSVDEKVTCECRHGRGHNGGQGAAKNPTVAFIVKQENGNVRYSCSGCVETVFCDDWKD